MYRSSSCCTSKLIRSRYIRLFTAPDILFQGFRSRPDWAGAMFLGAALIAAGRLLIPLDLTLATLREAILAQGQPVPPGLEDQGPLIRFAGAAAAFVFWPILMAFFAGLVMLFFAVLLGHEGTYRQYLAVVAHAQLIVATSGDPALASESRHGGRAAPALSRGVRRIPGAQLPAPIPELPGPIRHLGVGAGWPRSRQDRAKGVVGRRHFIRPDDSSYDGSRYHYLCRVNQVAAEAMHCAAKFPSASGRSRRLGVSTS